MTSLQEGKMVSPIYDHRCSQSALRLCEKKTQLGKQPSQLMSSFLLQTVKKLVLDVSNRAVRRRRRHFADVAAADHN